VFKAQLDWGPEYLWEGQRKGDLVMSDTIKLEIPINESPLPAALDAYYDFVKDIAKPGGADRLGIFGTITNYDIHPLARLYNDYVVRAFADRTVRTSPMSSLGIGDLAERYSARYVDMLRLLVASLDSSLPDAAVEQIRRHSTTINVLSSDRDTWLDGFEVGWAAEMTRLGIDYNKIDTDPAVQKRYFEERVIYMKLRKYSDRLYGPDGFNTKIEQEELAIESIRITSYPDDESRQLVALYKNSKSYETIRPRRPELEVKYGWDEFTIEDERFRNMHDIFDIGPMLESIVDPRVILNGKGARGYSVKTSSTVTNNHDNDWHVSGSASYGFFIKGEFGTANSSHFRSTVDKIREVAINFEHIGMLDVSRGGWFSSQVFDFKRVQEYLRKNPILTQKLHFLTTSLVVARGLSLKLYFKDASDVQEWGTTTTSGGGGFTIFGVGFGGGGGGSSSWEKRQINQAEQSVTFADDSKVCRLLGVKVTPIGPEESLERIALGARPLSTIPKLAEAAKALLSQGDVVDSSALFKVRDGKKKERG
jgi:hypothetical protein